MQKISVEKITLNIGTGKDQNLLKKGVQLLTEITGIPPVQTLAKKRIAAWGLRPGLPIGCKLTLRGQKAEEMLPRLIKAKDNSLNPSQFDGAGNISFGIPEYIEIEGAKYNPDIGIIGLEVCVTLQRPGYRVKKRKLKQAKIGKKHLIKKDEAMSFMKEKYHVKVGE